MAVARAKGGSVLPWPVGGAGARVAPPGFVPATVPRCKIKVTACMLYLVSFYLFPPDDETILFLLIELPSSKKKQETKHNHESLSISNRIPT
jgi:hypothetical protein